MKAAIDLWDLVQRIAARKPNRSEATLQSDIRTLLLAAPLNLSEAGVEAIDLETPAGERKRIDIEAGYTVIEVKRDLRAGNVREEAAKQLAGYVRIRSEVLGQRYVGILTDGTEWHLYRLTAAGDLETVAPPLIMSPSAPDVDALLVWLESVMATQQQLVPTPVEIEQRLGADSPSHKLDMADLIALYDGNRDDPSVALKRQLWAKLLTTALGSNFDDDDALFVEHTLLVVTAEVIAHAVVGYDPSILAPATLLSGALFEDADIRGVVESDFFDWVIEVNGGEAFVRAISRRISRFDWSNVEHDVMKVLYESVIGRTQRYDLGEYYTPDWLAERVVAQVVTTPLEQRVLDPACGSGTFLFHAIRRLLAAAEEAQLSNAEAIEAATRHVIGVDLHPLAVTFARLTYLLAIGMERIKGPRRGFRVPVYLGDSLQWGHDDSLLSAGGLTLQTGTGAQLFVSELRFPHALLDDADTFDRLVSELTDKAANRAPGSSAPSLRETFRRFPMTDNDRNVVSETFRVMCELHDEKRDHIWGYYVRNLARPVWLGSSENRVDVVVGNPPWLTYNAIANDLKEEFRRACKVRNLWGGSGQVARNYDLAALFVVRCLELYLKSGGAFAFVMPFATLSRRQFSGFRTGRYPARTEPVAVDFEVPWDLSEVRPHPFPVPCCVVFGWRSTNQTPNPLPAQTVEWTGVLPARNVTWEVAGDHLTHGTGSVEIGEGSHASPYAARFASGAKLNPQVLVLVEPAPGGPLGVPAGYRQVVSVKSSKGAWKRVPPLRGTIEAEFVRPLHLGSTIAPFRLLKAKLAVVPWDHVSKRLLTAGDDALDRYPKLAEWWRRADGLWAQHGTPDKYDLTGRIDYQKKLTRQLPPSGHRVVYAASGSRLTAARIDDDSLVSHELYWAAVNGADEACYLTAT